MITPQRHCERSEAISEAGRYLKNYVRSNTPEDFINVWALKLIDANEEADEIELRNFVFEEFRKNAPEIEMPIAFGVSFAFASLVRDRVVEILANGVGHA